MSTRRNSRQTARRPGARPRRYTPYSLYRRALRLEPLEDRRLLAVVTVNTFSDTVDFNDGLTSLREAIFATNTVPGADTIDFAPALTAGGPASIVLTQGELKISDALAISGPGASLLTINANQLSRVFNVTATTGDYAINGLRIVGGRSVGDNLNVINPFVIETTFNGGAIRSATAGTLTITGSVISGSSTEGFFAKGGGIWAAGPVSLIETRVVGNHTSGDRSFGAGLSADGKITLTSSEIIENSAAGEGGFGGGIYAKNGLVISNSTIRGNSSTGLNSTGGGIYVEGELTADHAIIENNKITGGVGFGGGIDARGSISLTDSVVSGNSALGGNSHGGGINATGGGTITRTTVSNNIVSNGNDGGGIRAAGTLTVVDSVISGNKVQGTLGLGGGIYSSGTLIVLNSTISGNSAAATAGGGIYAKNSVTLKNSTITKNQSRRGGGVWIASGSFMAENSIIAQNTASFSGADLINQASQTNVSHSLIGNNSESSLAESPVGVPDASGNLIGGTIHGLIDPLLGPLANNGGPTMTHALLPGSPAVNAGDLSLVAGANGVPQYDQRGTPFGRVFNGRIDIGAFEYQQPSDLNLVVDTLVDESDGNYSRGDLSLREAILLANTFAYVTNTIHFDSALTASGPATILLTKGELDISSSVSIIGLGSNLLTVDASGNDTTPTIKDGKGSRIFRIGATPPILNVSIRGLTLTGGDAASVGGAILNSATNLMIDDLSIRNNASRDSGGGLYSSIGNLVIRHSTIADNATTGAGGGIRAVRGNLAISDSTISGNVLTGDRGSGGGVYFDGSSSTSGRQLEITRSKILNNSAKTAGGGVIANGGTMVVVDSEIAANKLLAASGTQGGGVFLFGAVLATIESSNIHDNAAGLNGRGGGIALSGSLFPAQTVTINSSSITSNFGGRDGGGIYSNAVLQVTNTTIASNSTQDGWGGGGITNSGRGSLYVNRSTISENLGNGIRQFGDLLTVMDSIISGNTTTASGGGIFAHSEAKIVTITRTQIVHNYAALDGGGIAIFRSGDTTTVLDSTISNNSAGRDGGGITVASGKTYISRSTLEGNTAVGSGGGVSATSAVLLEITASTFNVNSAKLNGGAIRVYGPIHVLSSTISGNSADALGGGAWTATAEFVNSTIFQNHAGVAGGGVFIPAGTLTFTHTIVAGDMAPAGPDVTGLLGATITAKYSLIGSNAGSGLALAPIGAPDSNGNIIGGNIDPKLAPLSKNAGPTAVHVPLPGSPVINAGDPTVVSQGTSDQRGAPFTRVYDGRIDIGSVEAQPNPLLGDYDKSGSVDAGDYVLWRKTKGSSTDLRADGNGDRLVNDADYQIWRAHFGETRQIIAGPVFASAAGASGAIRETDEIATPVSRVSLPTSVAVPTPVYAVALSTVSSTLKASPPLISRRLAAAEPASAGLLAWLLESDGAQRSPQRGLDASHATANEVAETNVACAGETVALDDAFATMSRSKIRRAVFAL